MKYAVLQNGCKEAEAQFRVQLVAVDEQSADVLKEIAPVLEQQKADTPDWTVYLSQYGNKDIFSTLELPSDENACPYRLRMAVLLIGAHAERDPEYEKRLAGRLDVILLFGNGNCGDASKWPFVSPCHVSNFLRTFFAPILHPSTSWDFADIVAPLRKKGFVVAIHGTGYGEAEVAATQATEQMLSSMQPFRHTGKLLSATFCCEESSDDGPFMPLLEPWEKLKQAGLSETAIFLPAPSDWEHDVSIEVVGLVGVAYAELHCHTHYSLLDGASSPMELVQAQKLNGSAALAITDHNTLRGIPAFLRATRHTVGIQPIVGCELNVEAEMDGQLSITHLVTLVANMDGLNHLQELARIAKGQGAATKDDLRLHASGLIALSGCLAGEISRLVISGREQEAGEAVQEYQSIFGKDNFYIEVQNHGLLEERVLLTRLEALGKKYGVQLAATNDVHYARREDQPFHDLLICLQQGCTMQDEARMSFQDEEYFLKSTTEMQWLFRDSREALANTAAIAARCLEDEALYHFLNYASEDEIAERFGQTSVDASAEEDIILAAAENDYDYRHAERMVHVAGLANLEAARREAAYVLGHQDDKMAEKLCRLAQNLCAGN